MPSNDAAIAQYAGEAPDDPIPLIHADMASELFAALYLTESQIAQAQLVSSRICQIMDINVDFIIVIFCNSPHEAY